MTIEECEPTLRVLADLRGAPFSAELRREDVPVVIMAKSSSNTVKIQVIEQPMRMTHVNVSNLKLPPKTKTTFVAKDIVREGE